MPDSSGAGPKRHNRANWVALRTLRQLPKIVGETGTGEPIFEVRSVRLLLHGDANHFSRMAACAKCGREVPGAPVLTAADLEHSPNPVICRTCVKNATAPAFNAGRRPAVADSGFVNGAGNGNGKVDAYPAEVQDSGPLAPEPTRVSTGPGDDRLGEIGAQLDALGSVVANLVRGEEARDLVVAQENETLGRAEDERTRRVEGLVDEKVESVRQELTSLAAGITELTRAQQDQDRVLDGVIERLAGTADDDGSRLLQVSARIDLLAQRLDGQVESTMAAMDALRGHVAGVVDRQRRDMEVALDEGLRATGAEVASLAEATGALAGAQEQREHTLATQLQERADAQRVELRAALDADVAGLRAALDDLVARADADVARAERRSEELGRAHEDLDRRFDERLRQLDQRLDAEIARTPDPITVPEHGHEDQARLEAQVNDRLDRRAERAERQGRADRERLEVLDRRVEDLRQAVDTKTDSIRTELVALLRDGVADIRSAVTVVDARTGGRLDALDEQLQQGRADVSTLAQLQVALDEGLGQLRSEIGEVREEGRRRPAVLEDAVPEPVRPVFVDPDRGRGRGGRSAAKAELAAVSAATGDLVRERRQLAARITRLEDAVQAAADAAAHAARQAAAVIPLRRTVTALQSEVEAKDEALAELTETVEKLRRTRAKPAASPTRKATAVTKSPAKRKSTLTTQSPAKKSARRTTS